jgi:hypothetical protein
MIRRGTLEVEVQLPGQRIRSDPAGKYPKSLEHGSSIPAGYCPDFFRWIPDNFLCFPAGTGRFRAEVFDLGKAKRSFESLYTSRYK